MTIKVARVRNISLDESDIDVERNVPARKGNEANMIIRVFSRSKRDACISAVKKSTITTTALGFTGPCQNLYEYKYLTSETKRLLGAANEKKK